MHLRSLEYKTCKEDKYPYNLNVIKSLDSLEFESNVVVFVGDNGSGKSTLLRAMAKKANLINIARSNEDYKDNGLDKYLSLSWTKQVHKGFYLSSEDFIYFINHLTEERRMLEEELKRVDRQYANRSNYARNLAKISFAGGLSQIDHLYKDGLDKLSHGEGYLELFSSRLVEGGIYFLDEPETALSTTSQLAFVHMINDMRKKDCQFIIASHSPIIMAIKDASILFFDQDEIRPQAYEDIEQINILRDFLNDPDLYLRHLE